MKKFILSVCAVFAATFSVLAATAVSGGRTWTYDVRDGEAIVRGVDSPTGALTVPSELAAYPVTGVGDLAFYGCDGIVSVSIPPSVTWIGFSAFSHCDSLKSVTLSAGVKSIGMGAFSNCPAMSSVTIPAGVTYIGDDAFGSCDNLTSIFVDPANTSFSSRNSLLCDKEGTRIVCCPNGLTEVTVPSTMTYIAGYAFSNCRKLVKVTIPDSVESIGYSAFAYCVGLKSVAISPSVKEIGTSAFSGCVSLRSVTIPPGVKDIESSVFSGCAGLKSVTIPSGVKSIGRFAFSRCAGLSAIKIPSGVTSIGEGAFDSCNGLTSITIPSSVTDVEPGAFATCEQLKTFRVEPENPVYSVRNGLLCDKRGSRLVCCPGGVKSVTIPPDVMSIGEQSFGGCVKLASVTIPSGVTSIGRFAFIGCDALTSMTIPAGVMNIGIGVFMSCFKLTSIHVEPSNPVYCERNSLLCDMNGTRVVCCPGGLASVTFPPDVTSIGDWAFFGRTALTSVTLPESVTSVGDRAFERCVGFVSVANPAGLTNIGRRAFSETSFYENLPDGPIVIGQVFCGIKGTCPNEVVIPEGVTSIGGGACEDCGLRSVTIPSSVTSIGDMAFYACNQLVSVTIPESVTSIGEQAFGFCMNLAFFAVDEENPSYCSLNGLLCSKDGSVLVRGVNADVTIPPGVTRIADFAFEGCWSFASTEIPDSVTSIGKNAFRGTSFYDRQPDGLLVFGQVACGMKGTCPSSVEIPETVSVIGDVAFEDCVELKSVTIPPCVKSIGTDAFEGCASLRTVRVDNESEVERVRALYAWPDGIVFRVGEIPTYVLGEAVRIETGWIGYTPKGLPSGFKYDKKTGVVSGAGKKAGAFEVTFTAKNQPTETLMIVVEPIPEMAVGTFNGFVGRTVGDEFLGCGTFVLTATAAGKLTAKIVTAAGTTSLSQTGWDSYEDGTYGMTLTAKKGEVLSLALDLNAAWDADQLTGTFLAGGVIREVRAQRNAFGTTWYFAAEGDAEKGWTLDYADDAKSADLTVKVKADGTTSLAGKLGDVKVSASGALDIGGLKSGALIAEFVPVVSVKDGKKTVKKAVSVRTNLWFDRKSDHPEGVGAAKFVE